MLSDLSDAIRTAVHPALGVPVHKSEFCCNHDLVANRSERFANQFLFGEWAIGLGGNRGCPKSGLEHINQKVRSN